jgi:hypothetical protein
VEAHRWVKESPSLTSAERWHSNWSWYVALLKKAATVCDRAEYRWAAHRIFNAMRPDPDAPMGVGDGMNLLDAYRWSVEGPAEVPSAVSEEVMEDLVGKKIVFRDGWGDGANYLLLNYRDEGPFAVMARDYLRHTIPVEEEKVPHGRSDANFLFGRVTGDTVEWAGTNLVGMRFGDQVLFEPGWSTFTLEPDDWATRLGAGKWRYWEGETTIRRGTSSTSPTYN